MTKRMIIISECSECPHSFRIRRNGKYLCDRPELKGVEQKPVNAGIQETCPLPYAPQQQESE